MTALTVFRRHSGLNRVQSSAPTAGHVRRKLIMGGRGTETSALTDSRRHSTIAPRMGKPAVVADTTGPTRPKNLGGRAMPFARGNSHSRSRARQWTTFAQRGFPPISLFVIRSPKRPQRPPVRSRSGDHEKPVPVAVKPARHDCRVQAAVSQPSGLTARFRVESAISIERIAVIRAPP
jgi:hypothetical protein